ncbi:hypothetical protein [Cupriavidus necator]
MDPWIQLDEDALRQYFDAKAVFEAWEFARDTFRRTSSIERSKFFIREANSMGHPAP